MAAPPGARCRPGAGYCSLLERNQDRANARFVAIAVTRFGLAGVTATAIGVGTYPVVDSNKPAGLQPDASGTVTLAAVSFGRNGTTCEDVEGDDAEAVSGTARIDSVSASSERGSFDVRLRNGTRVATGFDAPTCDISAAIQDSCENPTAPPLVTCTP